MTWTDGGVFHQNTTDQDNPPPQSHPSILTKRKLPIFNVGVGNNIPVIPLGPSPPWSPFIPFSPGTPGSPGEPVTPASPLGPGTPPTTSLVVSMYGGVGEGGRGGSCLEEEKKRIEFSWVSLNLIYFLDICQFFSILNYYYCCCLILHFILISLTKLFSVSSKKRI